MQDVEEVAGDDQAVHQFGRVPGVEARADAAPAGQAHEVLRVVAQRGVHRIREHTAVAAGDVGEAGGIAHRQALEQRRVDEAEDRGVGADAERQRQDDGDGEAGLAAQHPGGVAEILEHVRGQAATRGALGNRRRHVRLPQRAHVAGERVVVVQFLEGELACVEVGDAVGAQRVVAIVEVLRQLVDDFPLAGGGQRQRREARPQVRRPVPRRGARWSRVVRWVRHCRLR